MDCNLGLLLQHNNTLTYLAMAQYSLPLDSVYLVGDKQVLILH